MRTSTPYLGSRVAGIFGNPKVSVSVVFVAAMFLNILDTTIVNVTLPTLSRELPGATPATVGGAVVGYLVSLAVFIPAAGWLGDRFGTKRVFLTALALFTVASALCGLSGSLPELTAFRVLQGVGGGLMTPVGMAMLFRAFPPAERLRASRILVVPTALAPALGPVLGGLLIDVLNWHWVFYVNVPIGVLAFGFGALFLTEWRQPRAGRFDLAGFALAGAGFAAFMYALSEGADRGWGSPVILATGLGGVALLVVMVLVELRRRAPMLHLRVLGNGLFRTASITTLTSSGAFLGTLFLFPLYLQNALHLSALQSGLSTFPEALGVMLGAQLASRLYNRIGPRRIMAGGLLGVSAVVVLLGLAGPGVNLWYLRVLMFLLGLCMAHNFTSAQTAAFATISTAETGQASALYNALRQAGAALGVALVGTVLALAGSTRPGPGGGIVPYFPAYHVAYFLAAGLAVASAVIALAIDDRAAAVTMRQPTTGARAGAGSPPAGSGVVEPVRLPHQPISAESGYPVRD